MMQALEYVATHHLADAVSISDGTGELTYSHGRGGSHRSGPGSTHRRSRRDRTWLGGRKVCDAEALADEVIELNSRVRHGRDVDGVLVDGVSLSRRSQAAEG